ncbi:TatD family hydrolase [Aestuariispira insulae]|uniref:TatD DNase family protein n=1 Tax=Aestuariispira insulae TaxID=1461337 RepID=A0A3D9HQ88_9PROT|nr:TatD family hydrolase [Aestuariispira insulae]RED51086.1 TatD DNase family protein [Aestuariispira insulae]
MLVDSHCHLDYLERDGQDLDAVVERARDAGVETLVTISTKLSGFPQVLAIAERYDNVYCTVGVHPHEAEAEPDVTSEQLVELAQHEKVIGIGETGLDYFYEHSPRELQQRSFLAHIEAARQTQLPLIVHTRDADDDTVSMLQAEYQKGAFPGVIHCFSSTQELAEKSVEIGFMISLSGIVTFKKAEEIRDTVRALPVESLIVETDSPYLAPIPHRGKKNEPAFVAHTANCVAELKGMDPENFARASSENFYRLFGKARATL